MQPFERHSADLAELVTAGSQLRIRAAEASELNLTTQSQYRPAILNWQGIAAPELIAAPQPLAAQADDAGRALAWAGLVSDYWAGEVNSFNRRVDDILNTVGQTPHWGAVSDSGAPSEEAVQAARHAAEQRWREAYDNHILDGADRVVSMLRDGPTGPHLAAMAEAGLLPQLDPHAPGGADWFAFSLAGAGLASPGPLGQYDPDALGRRLDLLRELGLPPSDYADLLQLYWVSLAAQKAGIDLSEWDPSRGAAALSEIIPNVYRYYGDLYLDHPYLQWAGMANLIGPTFAAGFLDLNSIRTIANQLGRFGPVLPVDVPALDNLPASELRFFETTFLQMHQDIFFDQAMMHEAYLAGGLPAIEELRAAGLIDPRTELAWGQIDEGRRTNDLELLEQGNTHLLLREQRDIIDDHYTSMYDRPVTGPPFTYLMGAIGEAAIPGTKTFAEHDPLSVPIRDLPHPPLSPLNFAPGHVTTPFPAGNLAHFDDRWDFIEQDTLPAYQQLLREDPELARQMIATDPAERIEEYRLHNRVDSIVGRLVTGWGIDVRW